jgi:hypothetical protein
MAIQLRNEVGSIAPLALGLFSICLGLILTIISASSLFIFQKRLTNYSESVALYVKTTGEPASKFVSSAGTNRFVQLDVEARLLPDGLTVEARACALWRSPVALVGIAGESMVCSRAAARSE